MSRFRFRRRPDPVRIAPEQGSGLGIAAQRAEGRSRITLTGHLDLTTLDAFAEKLAGLEADAPEVLEIDLRALDFMDSSGLGKLFAANRRARQAGRRVVILKGPGPVDRVLALAHVEDVIDVVAEPAR